MPMYESIDDLPDEIKNTMPREAQELYLNEYQRFWREQDTAEAEEQNLIPRVHRNAIDILKGKYEQDEKTGYWRPRQDVSGR